ncbi:unnamed protein product, partial [Didymodactylos carnosus]
MFSYYYYYYYYFVLLFIFQLSIIPSRQQHQQLVDDCNMNMVHVCKCINFPLFTLYDQSYMTKPKSLNQDLYCIGNETDSSIFNQLRYLYYRFRTITLTNYKLIPTKAFQFVRFDTQSVTQTYKRNNKNYIALINIEETQQAMFDEINLKDAYDQLIILFINSPNMIYMDFGLKNLYCYELKLINTNPLIPIKFFINSSIQHLIIQNNQFKGFIFDSNNFKNDIKILILTLNGLAVRHLNGKHFPIIDSLNELIINSQILLTLNSYQLSKKFPNLKSFTLFSQSIQHITSKMFKSFYTLEKLILNGITTIENEGLFNLKNLKELNLGSNILRLDPFAFYQLGNDQTFLL